MNNLPTILTTLTAILLVCIGILEWRTNKNRLRFALFDKRFKIYDDLRGIMATTGLTREISAEDITKCMKICREGHFIFSKEIAVFLNEVLDKLEDLRDTKVLKNRHKPSDPKVDEYLQKEREICQWISSKFNEAESYFEKYLRFK